MSWSLIVASNSHAVLESNLLGSVEVKKALEIVVQKGAKSAAIAYNAGIDACRSDLIVFAHQDVYFAEGWAENLEIFIGWLNDSDSNWGVVGIYGITNSGLGVGYTYSTGLRRFVGRPFSQPIEVRTLDEIILIIRRSSGLRFDERLPGFHLYGTDICLQAEKRGMKNYVIPCFALHNSCGIRWLPWDFWHAYLYLRKKWWNRLPIITPCTIIAKSCMPILNHLIQRTFATIRGKNKRGSRVENPEIFYKKYILPSL